MKKLVLFFIISVILISSSACQQVNGEQKKEYADATEEIQKEDVSSKEIKEVDADAASEGLNLFQTLSFSYEDAEGTLEMYTSASIDENGNPLWDDGQNFLVLAWIGEKAYPVFENQYVQLGIPETSVYYDDNNAELHIVLTDARTASYAVSDFVWTSETKVLRQDIVLDYQGGNYLGKF